MGWGKREHLIPGPQVQIQEGVYDSTTTKSTPLINKFVCV